MGERRLRDDTPVRRGKICAAILEGSRPGLHLPRIQKTAHCGNCLPLFLRINTAKLCGNRIRCPRLAAWLVMKVFRVQENGRPIALWIAIVATSLFRLVSHK